MKTKHFFLVLFVCSIFSASAFADRPATGLSINEKQKLVNHFLYLSDYHEMLAFMFPSRNGEPNMNHTLALAYLDCANQLKNAGSVVIQPPPATPDPAIEFDNTQSNQLPMGPVVNSNIVNKSIKIGKVLIK